MSEQTEKRTQGPQTYVVQMWRLVAIPTERQEVTDEPVKIEIPDVVSAWVDIATVTVPPRTPRKVAIKRALAEAEIAPTADGSKLRLRALDADSFETHEPEAHQPPPEWRL